MSIEMLLVGALALMAGAAAGWFYARARFSALTLVADERDRLREERLADLGAELKQAHERYRQQLHGRENELNLAQLQVRELDSRLAATDMKLQEERKLWESKLALLNEAKEKLGDAFKVLAGDALKSSNQNFLELAKETLSKFQAEARGDLEQRQAAVQSLVSPIRQSLDKVHEQIQLVEQSRAQAYGSLTEHIGLMVQAQDKLRTETGNLVKALRAPQARGRWGEIQLQRVVEMAGMVEHCDFQQQASVTTDDGKLRPDMVVRLPGGKNIVVDAKAPLAAYLEALEAVDEPSRIARLDEHAQQVRAHLGKLGSKAYWQQFQPAPEFVVLFLPGESFFSAALQQDPRLIEEGVNQQVIVATPTTLIALLRAVAYGWRQEQIAETSQKVAALGQELYERIRAFAYHLAKVGNGLDSAVEAYNKSIGSLETRVLVSARRFKELGAASGQDLPEVEQLQKTSRGVAAMELRAPADGESAAAPAAMAAIAGMAAAEMATSASDATPPSGAESLDPAAVAAAVDTAEPEAVPAPEREPEVPAAEVTFPTLEEVLAAPVRDLAPSIEEIMAMMDDAPPTPPSPS